MIISVCPAYLPSVEYMSWVINQKKLYFLTSGHYQKQTYRNRAEIYGPNGKLKLIIPVTKNRGSNHQKDIETGLRLGHATMDIRYHAGGNAPQTVIPNQQLTMMMEFQAIDAILPAGHGLRFVMSEQGEDYLAPACGPSCTVHVLPSSSTLELPIIDRDGSNVLITPKSSGE